MILALYDKNHTYIGSIAKKSDLKRESQLNSGDKTISFINLDESKDVIPEYYIRDDHDEYVVKEVDRTTTGMPVIYAALNLEELEGKAWKAFQAKNCTIAEAAQLAIAGTGWTVAGSNVTKTRNAGIVKKSALGVLQDLCTAFLCEMSFDTVNKTITFYEHRGSDRGVYFLAGLNLMQLTKKTDSYDYYTRIVPYGADGLDIKDVNGGVEYLDNNQYSGKVRTYIWEDANYTDAQALKDDAAARLADMSKPKVSYSAQVIDLAEMSAEYSLLDYNIGDTVTLIDKSTGTRDKQRIVKLTEYPEEPDRNTCELSNTFLTWEEMQAKLQASAAIVDALIGSDGNYNGTIKVSDILHFTDGVVGNSSGRDITLGDFIQTTAGALGTLNLEVGRIAANMLTAETADLKYANITFGNIDTANINTAKIKDLFVEVGLIKDAVISGAKITGYLDAVEVNAANITAGTLIADRIAIRGSTTSLVYALNNYGQITSTQTNTIDGYILTERTINANKIVANSITGGEIAANTITAFNIVGDSLSAIYANLGTITAGVMQSFDYKYSSGTYISAGMIIDLNNKLIRSKYAAILGDGKLYASGGAIGPWNITDSSIWYGNANYKNANGYYFGTSGLSIKDKFYVTSGGVPYCNGASLFINTPANQLTPAVLSFSIEDIVYCSLSLRQLNNEKWIEFGNSLLSLPMYLNTSELYTFGIIISESSNSQVRIVARNSKTGNRIFIYADPNGQAGLYSYDASNTARAILVRGNNTNAVTAYGEWTFAGNLANNLTLKTTYNLSAADNGVSSTQYPTTFNITDASNRIIARLEGIVQSDGVIGSYWYIQNYNTSGTRVGVKGIKMSMDKSGNLTYTIADPAKFRSAISAAAVAASDIRLKDNIEDSTVEALPLVNKIKIREFDWKDGRHQRIGVIADELEKLDDKLTVGGGYSETGEMNVKSVDTFYLVGYLVKAIQELSAEVATLKRRTA